MRPRQLFLALLLIGFAATGHAAVRAFWTAQTVGKLRLDLVDDPTLSERLIFTIDGFVGVTQVTRRRVEGGEETTTTQPLYRWRFVGSSLVIYDETHPRPPVETLTLVRREGSFLTLRRQSGAIARFKMTRKV